MKADLEHATDAELERYAVWLLKQHVKVLLELSRRQSEARRALARHTAKPGG